MEKMPTETRNIDMVSLAHVSKGILNYGLKIGYTLALTVKTIAHGPMFADVWPVVHSNVL